MTSEAAEGQPYGPKATATNVAPAFRRGGYLRAVKAFNDQTASTCPPAQPPAAPEACARCRTPFSTHIEDSDRHEDTPFCVFCVKRCHERSSALHLCAVCKGE